MAFSTQLLPPSWETYTGAFPVLETGLGVNAEATMTWGFVLWTVRKGSLSWFVSPLRLAGMRFTTLIDGDCPRTNKAPAATASAANARRRIQNAARDFISECSPRSGGRCISPRYASKQAGFRVPGVLSQKQNQPRL